MIMQRNPKNCKKIKELTLNFNYKLLSTHCSCTEGIHRIGSHPDGANQVQNGKQTVRHQLDLHPGQFVELLHDVEEVHDQQQEREPKGGHGDCVEEGGPWNRVEARHFDADEAHQVEDDHDDLHDPLLGPPVAGVIADLRGNDRFPGGGGPRRVLSGKRDFGRCGGHL